jgi:hypothetical protein
MSFATDLPIPRSCQYCLILPEHVTKHKPGVRDIFTSVHPDEAGREGVPCSGEAALLSYCSCSMSSDIVGAYWESDCAAGVSKRRFSFGRAHIRSASKRVASSKLINVEVKVQHEAGHLHPPLQWMHACCTKRTLRLCFLLQGFHGVLEVGGLIVCRTSPRAAIYVEVILTFGDAAL